MASEETIFSRIVAGEIPCDKVYEDDHVLAFRDINPCAPQHVLIIPKRPLANLEAATAAEAELLGRLLLAASQVAAELGLTATGYRLVVNNGRAAGQDVLHLHLHLIGGRDLTWPPG